MKEKGFYITFDGGDLSGKSTQVDISGEYLAAQGRDVLIVREPGSTPIGEELRSIIKNPSIPRTPKTNLWLFSTCRIELIETVIQPALAEGKIVLSDRSWLSSYLYQGHGEGMDTGEIMETTELAIANLMKPDLSLLIKISHQERLKRAAGREGSGVDYFEKKGEKFYESIDSGMWELGRYTSLGSSALNAVVVDGEGSVEDVNSRVIDHINKLLKGEMNNGKS